MNDDQRKLALTLLINAVAAAPRGKADVAKHLGYSRPLLSRTLSPNDNWSISDKMAAKIIATYHLIDQCPGTGQSQPVTECQKFAAMTSPPMHNPASLRVWKACQSCRHAQNFTKKSNDGGK